MVSARSGCCEEGSAVGGGLCGSVALCEERVEGDHTMLWIARWNKFKKCDV